MKKKILTSLALGFLFLDIVANASTFNSTQVSLKPVRMEKDGIGFALDVSTNLDGLMQAEQKKKVGMGLASVLADNAQLLDKSQLDVKFDKETLLFTFKIENGQIVASSQKGFSSCVAQWFVNQSTENKARFNRAYLSSDDIQNANFVRASIADHFTANTAECLSFNGSIPTEDIQYHTNVYVENKIRGSGQDEFTRNLANIYDQSYGIFQVEAEKKLKSDLLAKVAKYFDSFGKIGLSKSAKLDAFEKRITEQKPFKSSMLFSLSLGGLLDTAIISEAFEAIQEGQKTPPDFERSLYWVNQIYNQCSREFFVDPSGKECLSKLSSSDFFWLEFSRSGMDFKFLIIQ